MSNLRLFNFVLFVSFLLGCQPTPTVKGVKATRTNVEATISSVNSGTVNAEQVAELAFGLMGRVSKLSVKLGDTVAANAILAELENQDLKSSLEMAEKELKRQQEIVSSRVGSQTNLDKAIRDAEVAKAQYERSLIRAPFSGLITEVNLEEGQLSQTTAITTAAPMRIVDTAPRYITAQIDEVDLSRVAVGLSARIKILAARREPFNGSIRKVIQYVSTIREQDRTSEIELSIDGEGMLLPVGASADVEIITDSHQQVVAVPARTILGRGNERFAYTAINGKVKKTAITLGLHNYDRAEILSGITEGEVVLFPSDAVELTEGVSIHVEETPWP